jgi:hypothetical protein
MIRRAAIERLAAKAERVPADASLAERLLPAALRLLDVQFIEPDRQRGLSGPCRQNKEGQSGHDAQEKTVPAKPHVRVSPLQDAGYVPDRFVRA